MRIDDRFVFSSDGWLIPSGPESFASFGVRLRDERIEIRMRPFATRRRWMSVVLLTLVVVLLSLVAGARRPTLDLVAVSFGVGAYVVTRLFPRWSRAMVLDDFAFRVQDAVPAAWFVMLTLPTMQLHRFVAVGDHVVVEGNVARALPLGPLSPIEAALLAEVLQDGLAAMRGLPSTYRSALSPRPLGSTS